MSRLVSSKRSPITALVFAIVFMSVGLVFMHFSHADTPRLPGDLNGDSKVDRTDVGLLVNHYHTNYPAADVNGDGKVDIYDLSLLLANYGKTVTNPVSAPVSVPVSAPVTTTPESTGPFQVIYLSKLVPEANAIAEYKIIQSNPNVIPTFRTDSVSESRKWESKGYNYYYMVASSDYTVCNTTANPYQPTSAVNEALAGIHNKGIYLHEVAAIYACAGGWNWPNAIQKINWPLLDGWVKNAQAHGKKVVWSEPAEGWQSLIADPTADAYFRSWGSTLVPVFATNYSHAPDNHLPAARAGALAAANRYGTAFGESIQSWYWIDPNWPYTSADATTLSNYGYAAGATYFEIEGTSGDMSPGTTYMNGVNAFIGKLGSMPLPHQSGEGAPLPTYH